MARIKQEIWANAPEMHESPLQFLFAGNFGLYIHFVLVNYSAAKNPPKNSLTTPYFGVKAHLKTAMKQLKQTRW